MDLCVGKDTCLVKGRMSCRSEKSSSVALRRALMVVCFCMQVEFMGEQQRKLQGELEQREQQVQELQRARNEMYEKLMEAENSKGRHDEACLHKELTQLQVGAGRKGGGQGNAEALGEGAVELGRGEVPTVPVTARPRTCRPRRMPTWSASASRPPRRTSARRGFCVSCVTRPSGRAAGSGSHIRSCRWV